MANEGLNERNCLLATYVAEEEKEEAEAAEDESHSPSTAFKGFLQNAVVKHSWKALL